MPDLIGTTTETTETYPKWTVLLGIGGTIPAGDPPTSVWYEDTDFSDIQITDKINQIPIATLTFHDKTAEDLKDQNIRIYLDGKKKFSGVIRTANDVRLTSKVEIEARGLADYPHKKVIENIIDIKNTLSSKILEDYLTYPGWTFDIENDNNTDYKIDYRIEKGNYLMHIVAIAALNYWDWWCEGVDSETGMETRKVCMRDQRGNQTPSVTFKLEETAYDATITTDKEKVKNSIVIAGSSSAASNLSTTATGFWAMEAEDEEEEEDKTYQAFGYLIGSESVLAEPLKVDDQKIVLVDGSGYESSGTVLIEETEFVYTGKDEDDEDGNTLTLAEKSVTAHDPQTPVLIQSLLRAYVPAALKTKSDESINLTFWLGNELVTCEEIDYWGLKNLTRGVTYDGSATPIYAHKKGTRIYSGEYSPSNPHANSSITKNSRQDMRTTAIGVVDRDGLDKYGSSILQSLQVAVSFGSHYIALDELSGLEVGDCFFVQEYGETTTETRRCTGIVFSETSAEIIFGLNEEWITQQFDDISKIEDSTYAKDDKSDTTEVIAVSDDDRSVQIENDDGTYSWIPLT
jgi:hypothetical protein